MSHPDCPELEEVRKLFEYPRSPFFARDLRALRSKLVRRQLTSVVLTARHGIARWLDGSAEWIRRGRRGSPAHPH